jgi:hypothetical protein
MFDENGQELTQNLEFGDDDDQTLVEPDTAQLKLSQDGETNALGGMRHWVGAASKVSKTSIKTPVIKKTKYDGED